MGESGSDSFGIRRKDQKVGFRKGREFYEDGSTDFGKLGRQYDGHREEEFCSSGDPS